MGCGRFEPESLSSVWNRSDRFRGVAVGHRPLQSSNLLYEAHKLFARAFWNGELIGCHDGELESAYVRGIVLG